MTHTKSPQSTKSYWMIVCIFLFTAVLLAEFVASAPTNYSIVLTSEPTGGNYIAWKLKSTANSYPATIPSVYISPSGTTGTWKRQVADYDYAFMVQSGNVILQSMIGDANTQLGLLSTQHGLAQTITLENITDITLISVKLYRETTVGTIVAYISEVNATNDPSNNLNYYRGTFDASAITTAFAGEWYNITMTENTTLTHPYVDAEYPIFSNYWDTNSTLIESGTGYFNVTLAQTNGTVILEINNTNITASNFTATVYNVSYPFTNANNYTYRWHSWGNGTNHLYNNSGAREYTVNSSLVDTTPPSCVLVSRTPTDINDSSTGIFNATPTAKAIRIPQTHPITIPILTLSKKRQL